jgi:hypothetical protein
VCGGLHHPGAGGCLSKAQPHDSLSINRLIAISPHILSLIRCRLLKCAPAGELGMRPAAGIIWALARLLLAPKVPAAAAGRDVISSDGEVDVVAHLMRARLICTPVQSL